MKILGKSSETKTELSSSKPQRMALLIGIRYPGMEWSGGESMDLKGSWNDVERWTKVLLKWGYRPENIRVLWDKPESPLEDKPTYSNILREMQRLMEGIEGHQFRFVFFGCHRIACIPRERGEPLEPGENDISFCNALAEARQGIVVTSDSDHCRVEYIGDSWLETRLLRAIPARSKLTMIMDTCEVGTPFPMPYVYGREGKVRRKVLVPASWHQAARVTLIGACDVGQKALEFVVENRTYGALTWHLTKRLLGNPSLPFREILAKIGHEFRRHGQNIVVFCSHLQLTLGVG